MFTTTAGVTVKDIQVKTIRTDSNPHNQNRVRKAWVLHCDENSAKRLQSLPQETKFMLYNIIDTDVSDRWIELMKTHAKMAIREAGLVLDNDGTERLADEYCMDADEQLLVAAQEVAESIPAYIETLPEAMRKQMVVIA
jgi:hypothetical protein